MNWLILRKKVVVAVEKLVARGVAGVWCFIVIQTVWIRRGEHLEKWEYKSSLFVLIFKGFARGLLDSSIMLCPLEMSRGSKGIRIEKTAKISRKLEASAAGEKRNSGGNLKTIWLMHIIW